MRIEVVDREMARVLAQKTEAQRLQTAWGMWRSARRMLTQQLRAENPGQSEEDIQREASRRLASGT